MPFAARAGYGSSSPYSDAPSALLFAHARHKNVTIVDVRLIGGAMLKKLVPVVATAIIASTSAWTAQFDLRPEQLNRMGLTVTQAKAIAGFKNVAVLAAVPDRLFVQGPGDLCAEIAAVDDWAFREQIEDHVSRAMSSRFTVVPVSYDGDALKGASGFGYTPRSALPTNAGLDGLIIIEGSVRFWHTAGMPVKSMMAMGYVPYALSELLTEHEPEFAFTNFTVQPVEQDAESEDQGPVRLRSASDNRLSAPASCRP